MAINTGTLNATYKVAYPNGIVDEIPEASKVADLVDFVPSELQNGKHYEQPVILTAEQGFTYSLDTQTAYDLNDSIGMGMESAIVPGADIVLDSTVGYNQAARASHSATAFKSVMSLKFENMIKSHEKRRDIAFLYGNKPIGAAAQQTGTIASSMMPIVISDGAWATGIWAGSENSNVVFVKASDNTAVDSLRSFKVAQVDSENKTVYFAAGTAGTAGTLTTLETAIEAYDVNIHFYGSVSGSAGTFAYADCAGLQKIITNTGSLFGISAATYDLWKGNTITTTGQCTMAKVLALAGKNVQKGGSGEYICMINPDTWTDLASNLAALRRFDGSYSKKKSSNGSEDIEYYYQGGMIRIVSYNIVKEGDLFMWPKDKCIRIGARKLGLNDPTRGDDEIFFTIPAKAGVGIRSYSNEAVFLESPAQAGFMTGIENSAA